MAYDIIIRSGTIIDGTGAAPTTGDIAIHEDKIAAVGTVQGTAPKEIDATGKYVVPGFIDITNHSDTYLSLFSSPGQESMLTQGVTTIIGGNCGSSLAPLANPRAIHGVSKWADLSQINVNWATFEEYLAQMDTLKIGVNFGSFAGYGTLRRGIIGDEIREMTPDERAKMKFLLAESVGQGAFGLSLGLSYGHENVSSPEEIIDIARVLTNSGAVLKLHLRSEGNAFLGALNEAVRISRETEVPVQINHLKVIGKKSWPLLMKGLELITNARNSGVNINFDVSPYSTTGSQLYLLVPAWARSGGFSELFTRIDNPTQKKEIIDALKISTLHYGKILITSAKIKNIVGHTLAEVARNANMTPEEAMLDTIRANEGRVSIIGRTVSLRNTFREIQDPLSFISSDGAGYSEDAAHAGDLVHPRCFGSFPHFWHRFVEEWKAVPLSHAVWKMSGGPAEKLHITGRGTLRHGNFADVAVLDPAQFREQCTYRNPFRYAKGVEWLAVNGTLVIQEGKMTQERRGRVIRRS